MLPAEVMALSPQMEGTQKFAQHVQPTETVDEFEEFRRQFRAGGTAEPFSLSLGHGSQLVPSAYHLGLPTQEDRFAYSAPHSRHSSFKEGTHSGAPRRKNSQRRSSQRHRRENGVNGNDLNLQLDVDHLRIEHAGESQIRPRTSSMPSKSRPARRTSTRNRLDVPGTTELAVNLPPGPGDEMHPDGAIDTTELTYRMRTFETTSKGIKNRGDSVKRSRSGSMQSAQSNNSRGSPSMGGGTPIVMPESPAADEQISEAVYAASPKGQHRGSSPRLSQASCSTPSEQQNDSCSDRELVAPYHVLILGSPCVGKNTLAQQFLTSESIAVSVSGLSSPTNTVLSEPLTDVTDASTCDCNEPSNLVSVMLDGKESMIDFLPLPCGVALEQQLHAEIYDAYVVVYSITDRDSLFGAIGILTVLQAKIRQPTILLVGNKTDLERNREIEETEGQALAKQYKTKFIETSALLNHQVDELLVGVLVQIRLREEQQRKKATRNLAKVLPRAARGALARVFNKLSRGNKRTTDLFVL